MNSSSIPELLAPAGSFEALKAAVENGADAVYLGGKLFNARASAANFELDELRKALAYAHERQVKIYVTVNILVADQEFSELKDYLYTLYMMGVDAVIVQDIGVAHFIREVLPELEIHASTQMTQNNSFGIKQLEKLGFSRVVLARETTELEIEKIAGETALDIEVFVHGALCISYSGQCLMSSYIGARSGNRGRCAQPCRLTYQLVDEKGKDLLSDLKLGDHLLSPRDLNLSDELSVLQRIGVTSLKIEGRMKRPEYVATVVRIYRKALDNLKMEKLQELDVQDRYELTQIFNRDFTTGYLQGYQGKDMMSFTRPNNRGTRVGRIIDLKSDRLLLKLENVLNIGDGLEIWTSRGREGITVGQIWNTSGKSVQQAAAGEHVSISFTGLARIGDRVFKTHDHVLMEQARQSFQEGKEQRKRPLKMRLSGKIGSKLQLEAWEMPSQQSVIGYSQSVAQEATQRPLEKEFLMQQLGRLGNTPFFLEELIVDLEGNVIIPVREINELRRFIVDELLKTTKKLPMLDKETYKKRFKIWQDTLQCENGKGDLVQDKLQNVMEIPRDRTKKVKINKATGKQMLTAAITDVKLVMPLLKAGADRIVLGGEHWRTEALISLNQLQEIVLKCASQGVKLIWRLPRIINATQSQRIFDELKQIASWQVRPNIMVANLAEIEMVQSLDPTWTWETDHFFHIFNQGALSWVLASGGRRVTLSTELNYEQIKKITQPKVTEIIVFGDMEMMVSEHCLIGSALTQGEGNPREKCKTICQKQTYYLKDRLSYQFPLETDRECRMHIFNAKKLNLITDLTKIADTGMTHIRLELHRVTLAQAQNTVSVFRDLWTQAAFKRVIEPEKTQEAMNKLEKLYPEGFTKGHFYRGVLT